MKKKLLLLSLILTNNCFGGWFSHAIGTISHGITSAAHKVASGTEHVVHKIKTGTEHVIDEAGHVAEEADSAIAEGMKKAEKGIIVAGVKTYGGLKISGDWIAHGVVHVVDNVNWRQVAGFTLYLIIDAAFTAAGEALCGPPCAILGDEAGSWISEYTVQKYVGTPNWQKMFGPYTGDTISMLFDSWGQRGRFAYQLDKKYSPHHQPIVTKVKKPKITQKHGKPNTTKLSMAGWPGIARNLAVKIHQHQSKKKSKLQPITKTQLDGYHKFMNDPKNPVPGYIWFGFIKKYPYLFSKNYKPSSDDLTAVSYLHYYLTNNTPIMKKIKASASDSPATVLASTIGTDILKPIAQVALIKGGVYKKGDTTKGTALEALVGIQKLEDIKHSTASKFISTREMEFFLQFGIFIKGKVLSDLAKQINGNKVPKNIQKKYETGLAQFLEASAHDVALVRNRNSKVYKVGFKQKQIGWLDGVHANLVRANLSKANLAGANLKGADLTFTNLSGANVKGADLTGVDLRGANLKGTKGLSPAQVKSLAFPKVKTIAALLKAV